MGVFASGHRKQLGFGVGIEIDLTSVMGWKLTWFLCAELKLNWF